MTHRSLTVPLAAGLVVRVGEDRKTSGRIGEQAAVEHLIRAGLRILERNYTCRAGEVDIVAADGDVLVFVEVKLRRPPYDPLEAVDARKQRQVARAAFDFLMRRGMLGRPARFDVVAVEARSLDCIHVTDAFDSAFEY
jgi:putative endonuclease